MKKLKVILVFLSMSVFFNSAISKVGCFDNKEIDFDVGKNPYNIELEGCDTGEYNIKVKNASPGFSYKVERKLLPTNKLEKLSSDNSPLKKDDKADVNMSSFIIDFKLKEQEQIIVEITRAKKGAETQDPKWVVMLTSLPKGKWETSWSLAIIQNNNERYFSKSNNDNASFTITEKPSNNDLSIIPAMFFTYVKTSNHAIGLNHGWSLGLGLDSENLTPFAGYNWTWYDNIGLTGGIAVAKRDVLLGEYRDVENRTISENITTLTEKVYRAEPFIALSYRF